MNGTPSVISPTCLGDSAIAPVHPLYRQVIHRLFTFMALALGMVIISHSQVHAADPTEEQAVQMIKSLPEYQAHATRYQCSFDDYMRMEDSRGFIPDPDMKACRVDVNTVAADRLSSQLILWQRFMVSASGEMFVWDRHTGAYITLDQWRSAGQW